MNRNSLLLLPALMLGGVCQAEQKPNIIFILADDMGYGDVSYYDSNSKLNTTNLDAMASEGVVFRDAHTSSSVSTPTRYSILTGRYNWRTTKKSGVLSGYSKALIPSSRTTMASMLRTQGYTTAFIGKWHLGWNWVRNDGSNATPVFDAETKTDNIDYTQKVKNGPTTLGFDYSFGICGSLDMPPYVYVENEMPTDSAPTLMSEEHDEVLWRKGLIANGLDLDQVLIDFTDKSIDYITEKANGEEPFFLYLPLTAPHTPIVPSADFLDKSGIGIYGDFVLMVDVMVGRVLDAVDRAGIKDNTLIVFTTDNGCSPAAKITDLIDQGHSPNSIYRGHKADLFDGGHRIPCIVRYPDGFEHHEVEQTICQTDFFATFAHMTGYELADNEGEDSYSILAALASTQEVETIREATVHHSIDGEFAIRQGDWKLLMCPNSGGWSFPRPKNVADWENLPAVQLYNMKDDPSETTNLQAEYPDKVKELRDLLVQYIEQGRSTPGEPQKNDGTYPWDQLDWMEDQL